MPSNADISLSIDMNINDAEDALHTLRTDLGTLSKYTDGKKISSKLEGAIRTLGRMEKQATRVSEAMKKLRDSEKITPEYAKLKSGLEEAQARAERLKNKLAEVQGVAKLGGASPTESWLKNINAQIKYAEQQAQSFQEKMRTMEDTGNAFTSGFDASKFAELREQLTSITNKMTEVRTSAYALTSQEIDTSPFGALEDAVRAIKDQMTIALTPVATFVNGIKKLLGVIPAVVGKLKDLAVGVKKVAQKLLSLWNTARSTISNLPTLFSGASRGASGLSDTLNSGFKTFIRYGFAVRSFFFLFRKLRAVVLEGLQEMGNAYPAFGASIDNFKNALETLKYTFVAAFAPIATTVIPILISLMNIIGGVITRISQLFAALTGQTTFLRAKAVTAQNNYSSSLGKTGKAAKATKKALDELTIAGFDDVEILKEANDAASGGGGGGAGGGGGGAGDDLAGMFEEVAIDQQIWDFAEKFRSLIAAQDWEGLGNLLGDGVNTVFAKAREILTSAELYEKIDFVVNAITTTLNSFVQRVDFDQIGRTLADGFNLIIHTLNKFWGGIDFIALGTKLSEGFNGFVDEFNWAEFGQLLYNKIGGILDGISAFFRNIDYGAIEEGLKTAIDNIKPVELLEKLMTTLGNVFGGIGKLVYDLIAVPIGEYFEEKFNEWEEMGGDVAYGILYGIGSAFIDIAKWIKKHIWDPFVEGFRDVFDMHSPSKAIQPEGENVGLGILEGIAKPFKNAKAWIKKNIFDKISKSWSSFKESFEIKVKAVKEGVTDAWTALKEKGGTVVKVVQARLQRLGTYASDAWTVLKEKGGTLIKNVVAKLTKSGDSDVNIYDFIKTTTDFVKNVIVNVQKGDGWFSDLLDVLFPDRKINKIDANKKVNVTKGSWNDTAFGATKIAGATVNRTVSQAMSKGSWNDTAFAVTKIGGGTVNRTVHQAVSKGNWSSEAYNATKITAASITKKITMSIGTSISNAGKAILKLVGIKLATGGIINNGKVTGLPQFANGGSIDKGRFNWWKHVPKYAGGTSSAHGSMFIAGEAGPEIVGHVGGRTEVLNKSQIASAIYSAVRDAMAGTINKLAGFISMQLANSANGVISAISHYSRQQTSVALPQIVTDDLHSIYYTLGQINSIVSRIPIPAIATGGVVPYSTTVNSQTQLTDTLNAISDKLNTSSSNFTTDELYSILTDVITRYLNVNFYIGDEQIARHANAGNLAISRRYRPSMQ